MVLCNVVGYDFRIKRTKGSSFGTNDKKFKIYQGSLNMNLNNKGVCPTKVHRIIDTYKQFYEIVLEKDHTYIMPEGVCSHNSNPIPQLRRKNYRSAHENIVWFARYDEKKVPFTFNFINQQDMKNVFRFPILGGGERLRDDNTNQALHPTQKPLELIRKLVKIHSNEGDLVIDPFMGSGTTALACRQLKRNFLGSDIDQKYVDMSNNRTEEYNKQKDIFDY